MNGATLQDRLSRGMGVAARVIGAQYDLLRPKGPNAPLRPERRVLRLPAVFDGGNPGYARPRGYDRALRGAFDTAYVAVGDYFVGPRGTLFAAMLPPLARPLCVLTNTVVDILRPVGPASPGLNPYGGVGASIAPAALLLGWPAEVLASAKGRPGELPGDGALAGFSVLLPVLPVGLRVGDLIVDQSGRRFVAGAVDQSELGWMIMARMVGV